MATPYDVIVLGLGGMGSAALRALAGRGSRVLGLEQFEPGHDRGSSSGGSRMIRQAYFEGPAYVPLLLRAYDLWRAAEHDLGERLLTLNGGAFLGRPESRTVTGSLAAARHWDLPHELLDAAEISRRWPAMHPDAATVAVVEPSAGFVYPERAVTGNCRLAAAAGAEVRTGERVLSWQAAGTGDGVRVTTAAGSYEAGRLVVTAGPWAPQVLADLELPLTVERQLQFWFAPDGPEYDVGRLPVFICEHDDGAQVYGFPNADGLGPKFGIFRLDMPPVSADTVDRTVHEEEVARMRRHLERLLPVAAAAPLAKSVTCLYTTSPDEHFVIDRHPEHPQVALATGFSGHGFKFVPVVGEILADLVTDGTSRHDIEMFRLARPAVAAACTITCRRGRGRPSRSRPRTPARAARPRPAG